MKNLFLHNRIHVNNISAKQNYLWYGDRMGPAMMCSSSQNSLRSIAMHDCLSYILLRDIRIKILFSLLSLSRALLCQYVLIQEFY